MKWEMKGNAEEHLGRERRKNGKMQKDREGGEEEKLQAAVEEYGKPDLKIRECLKKQIMEEVNSRDRIEDDELMDVIDRQIFDAASRSYLPLGEKMTLRRNLFDTFRRLGPLQELVDDPEVTEIMVNGASDIFIERKGKSERWEKCFEDEEQLEDLVQKMVGRVNRIVNRSTPICDARLEDGSRVNIVLPPIALNGAVVTIRKFPEVFSMKRLSENGTISEEAAEFLKILVCSGYNIFISGGTGSGKTTFLNALSEFIPEDARVITIEDAAELQIHHVKNLVRMETRDENIEGEGEISMGRLIKTALRMNPDRIIVGEVRGKEAFDMLAAMNTGHDGSLSTGHANGPADMLSRLENMVSMGADLPLMAIRRQIASAVDILIHIGRLRDKSRKVLSIMEIDGLKEGEIVLHTLFEFREEREGSEGESKQKRVVGKLISCGKLVHKEKLRAAGYQLL